MHTYVVKIRQLLCAPQISVLWILSIFRDLNPYVYCEQWNDDECFVVWFECDEH